MCPWFVTTFIDMFLVCDSVCLCVRGLRHCVFSCVPGKGCQEEAGTTQALRGQPRLRPFPLVTRMRRFQQMSNLADVTETLAPA